MNDVTIKTATTADAKLIADLSRETFYNAFAPANTKANMQKFMNEVFTCEKLMEELYFADNIFLLAYENNKPVGYVRMRDKAMPETEITNYDLIEIARIYTLTNAIGKGIGSMLMNECISIAKNLKRDSIWLGVWENNLKGISFYERFGFKKFGEHDFVLGDDVQTDWLMIKHLNIVA